MPSLFVRLKPRSSTPRTPPSRTDTASLLSAKTLCSSVDSHASDDTLCGDSYTKHKLSPVSSPSDSLDAVPTLPTLPTLPAQHATHLRLTSKHLILRLSTPYGPLPARTPRSLAAATVLDVHGVKQLPSSMASNLVGMHTVRCLIDSTSASSPKLNPDPKRTHLPILPAATRAVVFSGPSLRLALPASIERCVLNITHALDTPSPEIDVAGANLSHLVVVLHRTSPGGTTASKPPNSGQAAGDRLEQTLSTLSTKLAGVHVVVVGLMELLNPPGCAYIHLAGYLGTRREVAYLSHGEYAQTVGVGEWVLETRWDMAREVGVREEGCEG